ncbi:MAG: nucleoside-diphosphate sugar epimerase/dehydratase [Pseudomonadota bacterium]
MQSVEATADLKTPRRAKASDWTGRYFQARTSLIGLPAFVKELIVAGSDLTILALATMLISPPGLTGAVMLLLAPPAALVCAVLLKVYRNPARLPTPYVARQIATAVAVISLAIYLVLVLLLPTATAIIAAWLWFGASVSGMMVLRYIAKSILNPAIERRKIRRQRAMIYGVDRWTCELIQQLHLTGTIDPVVIIDDEGSFVGREISGLRVFDKDGLDVLAKRYRCDEVLVTKRSLSPAQRNELEEALHGTQTRVRHLPNTGDLTSGRLEISPVRPVTVEALLGREPVSPNAELMDKAIEGRSIMITGAGGSIGSEIVRQILNHRPKAIVLLENHELALFQIGREVDGICEKLAVPPAVVRVLGSCLDERLVERSIRENHVDTIYHAAAYKHVGLVEENPANGMTTNIFGTLTTARCAVDCQVDQFILVSTDKAVRPKSVMGASKRLAEMILQALQNEGTPTRFSMVRFGNVLGSSGSVVPLFREQIASGGPITVTHPDVYRYFMLIPEAAQLVIQAAAMAKGGEVFLLDMGEPVKIIDLARRMISLAGLEERTEQNPEGDIEIVFTGLKQGEKLAEELLIADAGDTTNHPRIMTCFEEFMPWARVLAELQSLDTALSQHPVAASKIRLLDLANNCATGEPEDWLAGLQLPSLGDWKPRNRQEGRTLSMGGAPVPVVIAPLGVLDAGAAV